MSIIFEPTQIGRYTVPNRMIMAPMSRNRAARDGDVTDLMTEYYAQRATAGLIIAESTMVNDWSNGMFAPGIYTQAHIEAWSKTVDAVHEKDGLIFLQLWNAGRAAHQSLNPETRDVTGPSAIGITREIMTYDGLQPATPPRAYTTEEIQELRADYTQAAKNALEAGFDGIEVHAAAGYGIDQFLQDGSNQRTDDYGGSVQNRYRFLGEVIEDAIAIWGADRVGVRLSPTTNFNEIHDSNTLETFTYVISQLNSHGLAYLQLTESMPGNEPTPEDMKTLDALRVLWTGPLITNGDFNAKRGAAHINNGKATAISYGRPFIANPDLVERYKLGSPLNDVDYEKLYGGDHTGYTDYPTLKSTA